MSLYVVVMRRLSPFDFYRTVDFIYIDFNLFRICRNCHIQCSLQRSVNCFGDYGYFELIIISDVANRCDLCYDKYIKNGEVLYEYNSK